jgi:hypothetical protein
VAGRLYESCKSLHEDGFACASLDRALRRLAAVFGLTAALAVLLVAGARAQVTQLLPRVTFEQSVEFTPHGPVTLDVVRAPRPVGPYRLTPVLSNDAILGRETVSSMERRLSSQATTVGVNGDFFAFANGRPSGILLRDGVLASAPMASRSSAGISLDGTLDVRRVRFLGTWRGSGQRRSINFLNEAPGQNGISLFTSDWGPATPPLPGSLSLVLSPFPPATPNADLAAPVTIVTQNAGVPITPGTAVLVARGIAATKLQAEAPLGTTVTVRLILQPTWDTVSDAIGGGPQLVRAGKPVYQANEAFTTSQIAPRAPRTAVGQAADGSILLVTTDGRQPGYSVGMTNFELAQTLVRLGAVTGMALDSGGSTTLAFDGTVLNRPSDGRERPVADALMLLYTGIYVPPPALAVVSPNGDGVDDVQKLAYKIVRPSNVTVTLTAPDGSIASQVASQEVPGTYDVPFPPPPAPLPPGGTPAPGGPVPPADGRWTLTVAGTDDQGLSTSATRRFTVNTTLGFLKVDPKRLVLPPSGGSASIEWTQTRAARVKVVLEVPDGVPVRTISAGTYDPGQKSVAWNGRLRSGKLAAGGRYLVSVTATNGLGSVAVAAPLTVRRAAGSK